MKFSNLEDRVIFTKTDHVDRDKLINEYVPFIKKTINSVVFDRNCDYLTIGMLGFSDAINKYDQGKGKFLVFAKRIIRNKIIDELRKNNNEYMSELKDIASNDSEEVILRRIEIENYTQLLERYDISFSDLEKASPKHKKTRENCKAVARVIRENKKLYAYFVKNNRLPIKETIKIISVSDKIFDRFRKYIIALVIVQDEQFGYLKEFIF